MCKNYKNIHVQNVCLCLVARMFSDVLEFHFSLDVLLCVNSSCLSDAWLISASVLIFLVNNRLCLFTWHCSNCVGGKGNRPKIRTRNKRKRAGAVRRDVFQLLVGGRVKKWACARVDTSRVISSWFIFALCARFCCVRFVVSSLTPSSGIQTQTYTRWQTRSQGSSWYTYTIVCAHKGEHFHFL